VPGLETLRSQPHHIVAIADRPGYLGCVPR
jgi:hypothetical protein